MNCGGGRRRQGELKGKRRKEEGKDEHEHMQSKMNIISTEMNY